MFCLIDTFFAAPGIPDHDISISGSSTEHSCDSTARN